MRRFIQDFSAAARPAVPRHLAPTRCRCSWSIRGRATCASCATSSRAWSCSSPGHEIQPDDLPRQIREGGSARFLPVHVGPMRARAGRARAGASSSSSCGACSSSSCRWRSCAGGCDDDRDAIAPTRGSATAWIGEVSAGDGRSATPACASPAIEPRDQAPPPNVVTITPGTKMAEIERAVIEAALKETRGNRRRAAEMLGIGERTLYRKIKEYRMPEHEFALKSKLARLRLVYSTYWPRLPPRGRRSTVTRDVRSSSSPGQYCLDCWSLTLSLPANNSAPPPSLRSIAGSVLPIQRAEELLATLPGVISARIVASAERRGRRDPLLTTTEVTPKQTVRNVESALIAHLGHAGEPQEDHRGDDATMRSVLRRRSMHSTPAARRIARRACGAADAMLVAAARRRCQRQRSAGDDLLRGRRGSPVALQGRRVPGHAAQG